MVQFLKTRPLLNTMVTYTVVWTASDISQQKLFAKRKTLDVGETVHVATAGALVMAPLVFSWLRVAEKLFPGSSVRAVVKKVVSGQLFFAPLAISSFFVSMNILEKKWNFEEELRTKFFKTWKTGMVFWSIVQTLNWSLVPHHYKPFIMGGASLVWSNFLCYMKEQTIIS